MRARLRPQTDAAGVHVLVAAGAQACRLGAWSALAGSVLAPAVTSV